MANKLYLRKCAYIFDSSHSNYFYGTKEQHAKKIRTENALKAYYDDPAALAAPLEYTQDENGHYYVTICGESHRLNDIQIAATDNATDYINHRRHINVNDVLAACPSFYGFCHCNMYSRKFKTLEFEFFTAPRDLGYIRVHFKGASVRFAIDNRTGELINSGECGKYAPITRQYLIDRLGIESKAALKEFNSVMDFITA